MDEEKYMRRCIELAQNGRYGASPNPMVGAVIVHEGKIIGEGFHAKCGQAHAEVNAIRSVKDRSLLKHATIYVSLEPCAHYGKTPPCADLIVKEQIPRIVIGCRDPFAKVAGRGIQKLKDAGREVLVGVLEDECRRLIRRFITFHTRRRPYVTLKWAESDDGFIDLNRTGGSPVRLSNELTAMLVHQRRCEHSAIMVGTRTALLDDPSLTVRDWYGPQPVRVAIDKKALLPDTLHLLDGSVPTLVFTETAKDNAGVAGSPEYIRVQPSEEWLPRILSELYGRGLQSLLVEGGRVLLQSFIDAGLWDEAYVERTPCILHDGVHAPSIGNHFSCFSEQHFGHEIRHYMARNFCE